MKALSRMFSRIGAALRSIVALIWILIDGVMRLVRRPIAADTYAEPVFETQVDHNLEADREAFLADDFSEAHKIKAAAVLRLDSLPVPATLLDPKSDMDAINHRFIHGVGRTELQQIANASIYDLHRWLQGDPKAVHSERPQAWNHRRLTEGAASPKGVPQAPTLQEAIRHLMAQAHRAGNDDVDPVAIEKRAYAIVKSGRKLESTVA